MLRGTTSEYLVWAWDVFKSPGTYLHFHAASSVRALWVMIVASPFRLSSYTSLTQP